jgi:nitroimidazol reductase NimA-like FMN-containing flavoprotein (pyridoxamine 5'-phosphate oxidase superfamily)
MVVDEEDAMDDVPQVEELTVEQCWEMLRGESLGRLAFRIADEVHILPINYAVRDESLLFLTGEGTKLLGMAVEHPVALEIDSYDDRRAASVVVRGAARVLPEDEAHVGDELTALPWVLPETPKYNVVRIDPFSVTGRSFRRA